MIRTHTRAYQGVRNVSFSENFAYVLNGWTQCYMTGKMSSVSVHFRRLFKKIIYATI